MNKATKVSVFSMLFAIMLATTTWAQVTKVRDARLLAGIDTTITIEAIMNTPDFGYTNGQFFVQDTTAGIYIYYYDVGGSASQDTSAYTGWTQGDTLQVSGKVVDYYGTLELVPDAITVLGSGTVRPNPTMIKPADLGVESQYQGVVVKLENVRLADGVTWPENAQTSSGVNVNVVSGDSSFVLRIDRDESYFDGAPAPTDRFNLIGVMARYNDDVQIMPFDSTDIQNIVKVTFSVNTATMPDTLQPNHYVGVFGGISSPTGASSSYLGQTIDWNNSTTIVTENQGGDYWKVTFDMAAGDTYNYKFWAGSDKNNGLKNGSETGWESGNNRVFTLPWDQSADTVAPLTWYEVREQPFVSKEDTVAIMFRVNVGYQVQIGKFDPVEDSVSVRGTPTPLDWGTNTIQLTKEGKASGDNLFYSGVAYFAKADLAASNPDDRPAQTVKFKFYLDNDTEDGGYETSSDRYVTLGALEDTTFHFSFFSNIPPTSQEILDTKLNFEVNVGILEGLGYFNSSIDTVFVRGSFNDWGTTEMIFNSFSGNYEKKNIPYTTSAGSDVAYKYYVKWDKRRDDPNSEYYLSGITSDGSGWEEPGITAGGDRHFTIVDATSQPVLSNNYNSVPPEALLTEDNVEGGAITITFSIDMNPAKEYTTPFDPAQDTVYLFVDTPFFALTNGITVAGDGGENFVKATKEEIERLTFSDSNGDGVYTLNLALRLPTLNHIGFRIAYGSALAVDGSLLANGGGYDPGRRYYQYIKPMIDENSNVTWPSTFAFPQLTWTKSNLSYEQPPNYTSVAIDPEDVETVNSFSLNQNYPNPFNPTTNITFNLGTSSNVSLSVYNVLGQKVASLLSNQKMNVGSHAVSFNAARLSSGIYFYRLEAGNFVQQRSMTLIK